VARLGVPLAEVCPELVGGRCRPNTVRAAAYDLDVFFIAAGAQQLILVPGVVARRQLHRYNGHAQCCAGQGQPRW
jgi:hypothetical protein